MSVGEIAEIGEQFDLGATSRGFGQFLSEICALFPGQIVCSSTFYGFTLTYFLHVQSKPTSGLVVVKKVEPN